MELATMKDFTSGRVKTLGWGVLNWCSEWLAQPDGDAKGEAWRFSREQALFILRFYAVNDLGEFLYHRGVLMRVKGWGKSPVMAALAVAELAGPVKFDGFDANGEPIGRKFPDAFVQVAALNEKQVENTMSLCRDMVSFGKLSTLPGVEVLASKITIDGKESLDGHQGKLERISSSSRGGEGNRSTFAVLDETHHWVPAEGGPDLARTIRRNLAKTGGRSIETTNSYAPGEASVAESTHNAIKKGGPGAEGILFDTRNAFVADIYDKDQAWPALLHNYGDSAKQNGRGGWVDLERIWIEVNDPDTPEFVARRYYFNQQVEGESMWLKVREWDALKNPDLKLRKADLFAVGFKGALRNGAAALVACRLKDSALFLLNLWEKPEGAPPDWEVPFVEIDKAVRKTLGQESCWKLVADPEHWQDIVGRWSGSYEGKVEELWLGKNKAKAAAATEQFETAVQSGRLAWRDDNLSRHVLNSHAEEVPQGVIIRKEFPHSKRYIQAAQAALLALEAATLSIEEGALDQPKHVMYGY